MIDLPKFKYAPGIYRTWYTESFELIQWLFGELVYHNQIPVCRHWTDSVGQTMRNMVDDIDSNALSSWNCEF